MRGRASLEQTILQAVATAHPMEPITLETRTIETSEILFLGTGTSGGLPDLACLLDSQKKCKTCWDAIEPGSRNRRQNTSIVIKTTFTEVRISARFEMNQC